MRKLLVPLMMGIGLASSAAQAAAPKLYVGAGFADSTLERPGGSDMSLGTISAKLGVRIGRFLSVEADLGLMSDDSSSIASESVVSYQAVFGRLGYAFDRTYVYAMAGQSRVEVDNDLVFNGNGLGSNTETVNVYGAGISLFGNETTAINLEARYFEEGTLESVHIGIRHFFDGFR